MTMLRLGQAARLTGVEKRKLMRAIEAGRLSATQRADGRYEVDSADLCRVYRRRLKWQYGPTAGDRLRGRLANWFDPLPATSVPPRRTLSDRHLDH
jgi:hypothetical protein